MIDGEIKQLMKAAMSLPSFHIAASFLFNRLDPIGYHSAWGLHFDHFPYRTPDQSFAQGRENGDAVLDRVRLIRTDQGYDLRLVGVQMPERNGGAQMRSLG